ncbi:MAG: S26 family signal peptidase, partial [Planctomycetales bacterium]
MFANVDNQLLLWINGSLAADPMYPALNNVIPKSNLQNGGDLAPVGVGSNKANVKISRLCVKRDVYYIAIKKKSDGGWFTEYVSGPLLEPYWHKDAVRSATRQVMTSKKNWPRWFAEMRSRKFSLSKFSEKDRGKDQFLALGDNSPQSKDGRLWATESAQYSNFYVERELLIGKALVIYWPLSHIQFVR